MFKKIAITVILLGLLTAGSLIADVPQRPTYYVEVETHGFAEELHIGYIEQITLNKIVKIVEYDVPSGTHSYSFYVDYGENPPDKIFAEGWGQYGASDYDECDAQLYYTNELELWIGVVPDDPQEHEK